MTILKPLLTTLPTFHGFCESIHSSNIDAAIESLYQGNDDDPVQADIDLIQDNIDYRKVHEGYAKLYCENFAILHKIPLRFESLVSPKEYNFTTDRIFAHISLSTVERLLNCVSSRSLASEIESNYTDFDGFNSSYSNNLQSPEWQVPLVEWDHNMIGTLISAYISQENFKKDLFYIEQELVNDDNGAISNLVWSNLPQEIKNEITAVV